MHLHDRELEHRIASSLMDVLIRAALILALVFLCYRIFSPFLTMMIWALILAVTLYPMHQALAAGLWNRQGLAASALIILGMLLVVAPTAYLTNSLGDSVYQLITDVQHNTLKLPPPPAGVAEWPMVGRKVHAFWSEAHNNLPGVIEGLQPKIGELAAWALSFVGSIGAGLIKFLISYIIAGVIMAFGQAGSRGCLAIFMRIIGRERGADFVRLSTTTVRAVALGVIGVAFIQAILVGTCLVIAGIPWAGILALATLVLAIAQLPVLLVTLPAIGFIWSGGGYGNLEAIVYTALLLLSGLADNVLKPLLLGRGVDAPMPVILIGALGGMAVSGILGMFVGATLLALGYQLFMGWVAAGPDAVEAGDNSGQPSNG